MSVFVSYSHDSAERVADLVTRLRADRVPAVVFDLDMLPAGPNRGWLHWSEAQARGADKVLIVCSERYCARYEGTEIAGVGCGAVLEGNVIRQTLYDAGGENPRYRVVVLSEADNAHVPLSLKTYHRFKVYIEGDYHDLLAWLGVKPAPTTPWERKIADCTDIFEAFERALAGTSLQRILLISGPSGHGKTTVMSELLAYARHLGATSALVDFKGCASLDEVFGSLRLDLRFLNRAGNSQQTIADLLNVAGPLLLVRGGINGSHYRRGERVPVAVEPALRHTSTSASNTLNARVRRSFFGCGSHAGHFATNMLKQTARL